MVGTDPDWRSVGPSFFFEFKSTHVHCLVRSVPVVHFCLEVCQGLAPGQANMQNRFPMICCHRRIGVPFGGIRVAIDNGSSSSPEPAISGLLPFGVHESTE